MLQTNENKAMRLEMVNIDHSRFAVEVLRNNARVNLTMMAKPFGRQKSPGNWLRTDEAKAYLEVIAVAQKCDTADLVEVRQGGTPEKQGTWCSDYHIAMRFAQWLSPKFSYAVDTMLVKLMVGDSVLADSINGVYPIIHNGKAYYNYIELVGSYGTSKRTNYSLRKRNAPAHFKMIYGRNFVTEQYAKSMQHYYEWRLSNRQLALDF